MGCSTSQTEDDFNKVYYQLDKLSSINLSNMALKKQPYYDILLKISQNNSLESITLASIEVSMYINLT